MAGDSAERAVGTGARTRLRSVLDRAGAPGGGASRPSGTVRPARRRLRAALAAAGFAGLGVLLFLAYLGESWTLPVNSDGAGNALQAWDMLHSNPLLHGWILTDVSFYTTELPQYMLVELVRGLGPDVIHVASAMTYTLLVLLVALLARGRRPAGRQRPGCCWRAGSCWHPRWGWTPARCCRHPITPAPWSRCSSCG